MGGYMVSNPPTSPVRVSVLGFKLFVISVNDSYPEPSLMRVLLLICVGTSLVNLSPGCHCKGLYKLLYLLCR